MAISGAFGGSATGQSIIPSAVKYTGTQNYVAASNLIKPQHDERLIERFGDQGITGLLEMVGAKKSVQNSTFYHWEEARLHQPYTCDTSVSSTVLTATIDGPAVNNTNASDSASPDLNADFQNIRLGDIVMFENGDIGNVVGDDTNDGELLDDDAAAIKIECYASAWTYSGTTNNQKFIVIGNEYTKGTDQPSQYLQSRAEKYTNYTTIIKDSYAVTGTDATNVVWVKVKGPMGEGYLWYLKGEADTYKRFLNWCEMSLMFGKASANGTLANAAGVISIYGDPTSNAATGTAATLTGTNGLFNMVNDKGIVSNLGGLSMSMDDIDDIVKELDKQRGAKEYAFYCNTATSLEFDNAVASAGAGFAGAVNQAYGMFSNKKDMAVNLGFASINRGGYTFHKKNYDLLNDPTLLGHVGYWAGIMLPMDTRKDAKTGATMPSLQIRYKEANGYSREMEHWLTGSAVLKNPTNSIDELKCHYRTERGMQVFAPNRFVVVKE
jgi:hypothetical protein